MRLKLCGPLEQLYRLGVAALIFGRAPIEIESVEQFRVDPDRRLEFRIGLVRMLAASKDGVWDVLNMQDEEQGRSPVFAKRILQSQRVQGLVRSRGYNGA